MQRVALATRGRNCADLFQDVGPIHIYHLNAVLCVAIRDTEGLARSYEPGKLAATFEAGASLSDSSVTAPLLS